MTERYQIYWRLETLTRPFQIDRIQISGVNDMEPSWPCYLNCAEGERAAIAIISGNTQHNVPLQRCETHGARSMQSKILIVSQWISRRIRSFSATPCVMKTGKSVANGKDQRPHVTEEVKRDMITRFPNAYSLNCSRAGNFSQVWSIYVPDTNNQQIISRKWRKNRYKFDFQSDIGYEPAKMNF